MADDTTQAEQLIAIPPANNLELSAKPVTVANSIVFMYAGPAQQASAPSNSTGADASAPVVSQGPTAPASTQAQPAPRLSTQSE